MLLWEISKCMSSVPQSDKGLNRLVSPTANSYIVVIG